MMTKNDLQARAWCLLCKGSGLGLCALALLCGRADIGAAESTGLWVGEVVLDKVNQVVVSIDEDNRRVAEAPETPLPTSDLANIRLIIHVDDAGQARLLKSVAVVPDPAGADGDVVLLTDPALYAAFPGPGRRYASAVFEFGDPATDQAVADIVAEIARNAADDALAAQLAGTPLEQLAFERAVTAAASAGSDLVGTLRTAVSTEEHDISQGSEATTSADYKTFLKLDALAAMTLGAARDSVTVAVATAADPRRDEADVRAAAVSAALAATGTKSAIRFANRASLNELPFAAGGAFLKGGTLNAEIYLGKHHPSNPFRHRRHPAHAEGVTIEREIALTVDGVAGDALDPGGYGTNQLSGDYTEEIFGLHKKLGADSSRGLITKGRFTVYRISTEGTLNK
ncbi:MAG: hypothetical protein ACI9UA_000671 [Pseudoalteromonas tetraodonis]|jgi:hypothetical protein